MRSRAAMVVWGKEIRDAARDPRALFYLVGLPLVFYPSLLLALEFLAQRITGEPPGLRHRVAIANVEHAAQLAQMLEEAGDMAVTASANPALLVVQGKAEVGLEPLTNFDAAVADGLNPRIDLYTNLALRGGEAARARVIEVLTAYEASLPPPRSVAAPGRDRGAPMPRRLLVAETVLAAVTENLGFMVGLFPYFLIVLVLVGAAHMAIDITAGEKERRTLETLLVSPADRRQILLGKVAATVTAAAAAGMIGMIGFAIAVRVARAVSGTRPELLSLPSGAFWTLGLGSLPVAFLLSALLVCLGVSARSSREGQTYAAYLQMPLFVLALGAGYLTVDSNPAYYLVPLLGTNLVQRAYLIGQGNISHAIVSGSATVLMGIILVAVASRLFSRESTLFRA